MLWNRQTKRLKVGKGKTLIKLIEELSVGLPEIKIGDKPMNHEEGLKNCVIAAGNPNGIADNIANYVKSIYSMYEQLMEDKEAFEKKLEERSSAKVITMKGKQEAEDVRIEE